MMKKETYYPPATEEVPLKIEGTICTSGEVPDYDILDPGDLGIVWL